jgi:hypothetical protein
LFYLVIPTQLFSRRGICFFSLLPSFKSEILNLKLLDCAHVSVTRAEKCKRKSGRWRVVEKH